MRMKTLSFAAALAAVLAWRAAPAPRAQSAPLPATTFHHLHLNSMNPNTAIDWYTKAFPATSKTTWAGEPALKSPNNVLILFTKVDQPPATQFFFSSRRRHTRLQGDWSSDVCSSD